MQLTRKSATTGSDGLLSEKHPISVSEQKTDKQERGQNTAKYSSLFIKYITTQPIFKQKCWQLTSVSHVGKHSYSLFILFSAPWNATHTSVAVQ